MGWLEDKLVWVDIDSLKPHPANREIFNPPMPEEYARLKSSMKNLKGDIGHNLLITEDGKIISGHWRVKAAKELGIKKLPARIFHPDWPGEEERLLIETNICVRSISISSAEKAARRLQVLKPPEEVRQSLIPPLQKLLDTGSVSFTLLAEISSLPQQEQEKFYNTVKEFFKITGEERVDSESFEKFKEVSQQNEDAIKKLEELEKELTEKNSLVEQLQKKILQAEAVKESSVEKMKKMESELEELKEKAKEEGKKELEQETQERINELVKKIEETDSKRMELVRETAKLKDELEQKKNRIKALEAIIEKQKQEIRKVYKKAMEEVQQKVKKKVEKLLKKEKALKEKEQEIVSQQFRSKVLKYYSDTGPNNLRAAYLWLQNAKFQLQSMVSFLGEVDTRARVVFGLASEFTLPEELETLRRELKGRLEEIIDAAELVIDTMENPENPIMDKIKEWARKATAPLRDDGDGRDR